MKKVRKRKINVPYMWNQKNCTNELINKMETDFENLWLPNGKGRGREGIKILIYNILMRDVEDDINRWKEILCSCEAKHLQLVSALHFLRKEASGLESRCLQSASSLHFEIERTTETGWKTRLCFLWTLWDNTYGRDREGLIPVWVKDQEVTYFPSLRQERHFTCPGRPSEGQKGGSITPW